MTSTPLNQYRTMPSVCPMPPTTDFSWKYASMWFQAPLYPGPGLGWKATAAAWYSLALYHGGMLKQFHTSTPNDSVWPLHPLTERFSVTPTRSLGGVPRLRLTFLPSCKASWGRPPLL